MMTIKEEILDKSGLLEEDRLWDDVNKIIDRYLKKKNIVDVNAKKLLVKIAEAVDESGDKYSEENSDKFTNIFLIKYTSNTEKDKKELEKLSNEFYICLDKTEY